MRVALDTTYSVDPHPSGIAVYTRELTQELAAEYPQDTFLHCYRPKQWRKTTTAAGLPNVKNRLLLPPVPTFSADVYHALNQRVDHRAAKRVVTTFHDLFVMTGDYSSSNFRRRFTLQAQEAAKKADLIIAVSEFTAKQVIELLNFEKSRVRVVPHGVRPPPDGPQVKREEIILFVGALQKRKNVGRLVAAMDHVPAPWRLVLAGAANGYCADEIIEQIARSHSKDRIMVTGYLPVEQLEELYRRASIFAFPSLDEGFGMPVLEAMQRGVPVLTSSGSALSEVAGKAAYLVDPRDEETISAGLLKLIAEPSLRDQLRNSGFQHALQFSWKRAAQQTWAVYNEALSRYF